MILTEQVILAAIIGFGVACVPFIFLFKGLSKRFKDLAHSYGELANLDLSKEMLEFDELIEHSRSCSGDCIVLSLESRPDGGLRVSSRSLPGLILSGEDPEKVMADIIPCIRALKLFNGDTNGYWNGASKR